MQDRGTSTICVRYGDQVRAVPMEKGKHIVKRILAASLDLSLVIVFTRLATVIPAYLFSDAVRSEITLSSFVTTHDHVPFGITFIAGMTFGLTYFVFTGWRGGQTIGKRIFNLKVFMTDGRPTTLKASIQRTLYIAIDSLGFLVPIGLIALLYSPQHKRLGDVIAHTRVVTVYRGRPTVIFDD